AISSSSPALPDQPSGFGAEWPEVPPTAIFNPSESGLRKIKPDEAFTGSQRAVKPPTNPLSSPLRPSPAEWQVSGEAGQGGNQVENISPISLPALPEQGGETLRSLASLRKASAPLVPEIKPAAIPIKATPVKPPRETIGRTSTSSMPAIEKPGKRNYPALAAALQTLGYSVPGFVASAVVSLDGTPIAQVAVDELDISPMCAHFSNVIQGVIQALEAGHWDGYEHTVITNRTQHVLLRIVGNKKDVFQVLVTTRETNPQESLEVMANVEAAIAAALH
ncbi:MAG TPA: roadblock/LC7 domain-containing protein, partial [Ktedonobacteraceae bacterium]|nr:roadblock/LC7 domain-containing protein [Ktedonobacteraceae bacterium]